MAERVIKFIKLAKKQPMISVNIDGKDVWVKASDAVMKFAGEHFKEGDLVNLEGNDKGKMMYVTKITKAGASTGGAQSPAQAQKTAEVQPPKPEEKKEEKAPASVNNYSGNKYAKSPEEQASIRSQAIGHMVSRTLIAMQGTVEPNNVCSLIDTLYQKYNSIV